MIVVANCQGLSSGYLSKWHFKGRIQKGLRRTLGGGGQHFRIRTVLRRQLPSGPYRGPGYGVTSFETGMTSSRNKRQEWLRADEWTQCRGTLAIAGGKIWHFTSVQLVSSKEPQYDIIVDIIHSLLRNTSSRDSTKSFTSPQPHIIIRRDSFNLSSD